MKDVYLGSCLQLSMRTSGPDSLGEFSRTGEFSQEGLQRALVYKKKIWKRNGTIRIKFGSSLQAYSLIGTDALSTSKETMYLGYVDPPLTSFEFLERTFSGPFRNIDGTVAYRNGCSGSMCPSNYKAGSVVLHEFGHALGLAHEHQNFVYDDSLIQFKPVEDIQKCLLNNCDKNTCQTNKYNELKDTKTFEEIVSDMKSSCGLNDCISSIWSKEDINNNILDVVKNIGTDFDASALDYDSIMMYPLSDCYVTKGPSKKNYSYSKTDLEYLQKWYPIGNPEKFVTLEVVFLDATSPDWMKYLIMKTVSENLSPYVGINFKFVLNGTELYNTKDVPKVAVTDMIRPDEPVDPSSIFGGIVLDQNQIIAIAVGAFAFLFIVYVFFIRAS